MLKYWNELKAKGTWGESETEFTYKKIFLHFGLTILIFIFILVIFISMSRQTILGMGLSLDNPADVKYITDRYLRYIVPPMMLMQLASFMIIYDRKKLAEDTKLLTGFSLEVLGKAVLIGLVCFVICYLISLAVAPVLPELRQADPAFPTMSEIARDAEYSIFSRFITFFVAVIFLPLLGELFWRGIVIPTIAQKNTVLKAICISTLILGFLQGSLPMSLILNFVLGSVYVLSGNLWYSLIIHSTFSLMQFLFNML